MESKYNKLLTTSYWQYPPARFSFWKKSNNDLIKDCVDPHAAAEFFEVRGGGRGESRKGGGGERRDGKREGEGREGKGGESKGEESGIKCHVSPRVWYGATVTGMEAPLSPRVRGPCFWCLPCSGGGGPRRRVLQKRAAVSRKRYG